MFDVFESRPRVFLNKSKSAISKNVVARPYFSNLEYFWVHIFSQPTIICRIFHSRAIYQESLALRSVFFQTGIRIIGCSLSIQRVVPHSNHSLCRLKEHHRASLVTPVLRQLTIPHQSSRVVGLAQVVEHLLVR